MHELILHAIPLRRMLDPSVRRIHVHQTAITNRWLLVVVLHALLDARQSAGDEGFRK
jgi:hypothetical protein